MVKALNFLPSDRFCPRIETAKCSLFHLIKPFLKSKLNFKVFILHKRDNWSVLGCRNVSRLRKKNHNKPQLFTVKGDGLSSGLFSFRQWEAVATEVNQWEPLTCGVSANERPRRRSVSSNERLDRDKEASKPIMNYGPQAFLGILMIDRPISIVH